MFRALLLLLASPALGQTIVEGPDATGGGRLGVEAGVSVAQSEGLDVTGPEALALLGLGRGVELRVGLPDVVGLDVRGEAARGVGDAAVGVKAQTGRVAGWRTGVLVEVAVPMGSEGVGGGAATPVLLLMAAREVGAVKVGVQADAAWDRALGRADGGGGVLVAVAWGRIGAFGEVVAGSSPDGLVALLHQGLTLALLPALQVDVRLGLGLTEAAPAVAAGIGVRAEF